jgi:hypothetical protein
MLISARPLHRQQYRAAPLATDPDPLDEADDGQNDGAPGADRVISRNEGHGEGGESGEQQGRNQGPFAADAIAVMTKDCCADRARDETHEIDSKSFEHADQRVGFRKEQLGEDEAGDNAV